MSACGGDGEGKNRDRVGGMGVGNMGVGNMGVGT